MQLAASPSSTTASGMADLCMIPREFEELEIPAGRILASPFCRTLDTARLAFGQAEPTPDLIGLLNSQGAEEELRMAALKRLLSSLPADGANTVQVGHSSNIREVAGVTLCE